MLSVNCIHNGQFYPAGTPTPYASEADLPLALKAFVARGDEPPPFNLSERNIYDLPPHLRRQVRGLQLAVDEKEAAEAAFDEPLREDIAEVLQSEHDTAIGRARALLPTRRRPRRLRRKQLNILCAEEANGRACRMQNLRSASTFLCGERTVKWKSPA